MMTAIQLFRKRLKLLLRDTFDEMTAWQIAESLEKELKKAGFKATVRPTD